jgi:hypothetical protein
MANQWLRLWHDMPTDPKWRTIAKQAAQRIGDVIAVYNYMLVTASNAVKRGNITGWNDEDIASALDLETDDVKAIREAMQGRVLDGEYLKGWEKRQPKREDNSSERVSAYRKAKKLENDQPDKTVTPCNSPVTQCNAPDKDKDKEKKKERKLGSRFALTELPDDWRAFCQAERPDLIPDRLFAEFGDYWRAVPGNKGLKLDWTATWRNRVRNAPHVNKTKTQAVADRDREARRGAATICG